MITSVNFVLLLDISAQEHVSTGFMYVAS